MEQFVNLLPVFVQLGYTAVSHSMFQQRAYFSETTIHIYMSIVTKMRNFSNPSNLFSGIKFVIWGTAINNDQ